MADDVNDAPRALDDPRLILDALPRAIVVTSPTGTILQWNSKAEDLYGWRLDEVIGRDIREVILPAQEGNDRLPLIARVLDDSRWAGDLSVLRRDGSPVRIYAAVAPLRNEAGAIVGVVAASEDVTDLRLKEQAAADLAEHLRLALEAGALGTWRWDRQTGTVVWDERLERLFGLEPGTFDGSFEMYLELLHPEDRPSVLDAVNEAVETKSSYQVDHRVIWPDGSVHWLQGRGSVTLDADGTVTGTIGCTADISVAKHAEEEARRHAEESIAVAERERRQRERLEFLVGLTDASIRSRNHQEFIEAVTAAAVPRLGDWCSLHFQPEAGDTMLVEIAHTDPERLAWVKALMDRYPYDPDAEIGVGAVIRTGEMEFVPLVDQALIDHALDRTELDREEATRILDVLSLTSIITVPLITKRGTIGAMQFVSAESGRRYDQDDVSLALAAAGRIAEALENLWLTDQHRHISASLQKSLLPVELPDIPDVDVAVRYWPAGAAAEVGGDFYDVFGLGGDRWAVVIGDVCGKGPDAAAVTGIARHTIRAAARQGHDHRTILEWVNDAVRLSGRGLFCTACYATLTRDGDAWELTSTLGGHPRPIIVREDGSSVALGRAGTLLGMFETTRSHPDSLRIDHGDTVVFYTDGVTDLPPPHGIDAEEAQERIAAAAQRAGDADEVADAIRESLVERVPIERRQDDIALVVLRSRRSR